MILPSESGLLGLTNGNLWTLVTRRLSCILIVFVLSGGMENATDRAPPDQNDWTDWLAFRGKKISG
ncbi:MAG: hypothetical protein ONB25_12555 [candidate division KSB1 bacterium]|nr:hypothetical protein [candidate division KSB1 bacterium]